MKVDTHPEYHTDSKFTCSCGEVFPVGSTNASTGVEICSKCHPFYTGNEKVLDTAGRVERFKQRSAKAKASDRKPQKAKAPEPVVSETASE
jgi:large subunit ribosomal protein L31